MAAPLTNMIFEASAAFIPAVMFAAVATATLGRAVIRIATNRKLFDVPGDARRVHTAPTPRLGGIAVFLVVAAGGSVLVSAADALGLTPADARFINATLIGATLLFIVGLIDDLRGVRPRSKLVAQIAAAAIVCVGGLAPDTLSLTAGLDFGLQGLAIPLVIFWIVLVSNAFNLIDGIDGLAGGLGLVVMAATLVAATLLGRPEVLLLSGIVLGASAGFLRLNRSPARIFLGDCGSLVLGFLLATLTVRAATDGRGALHVLLPLGALAIPLADTSIAIGRRWLRGVGIFSPDRRHIHHQLLALGFNHRQASATLALASLCAAGAGLILTFAPRMLTTLLLVAALLGLVVACITIPRCLRYHEFGEAIRVVRAQHGRARRTIRDQLLALDTIHLLRDANTAAQFHRILTRHAPAFGFRFMGIVRAEAPRRNEPGTVAYEVAVGPPADGLALRIIADAGAARATSIDWIAGAIAEAMSARLIETALERRPHAWPQVVERAS
jgi:UDP-GlcNAc:undecaprenyl-phosphate GlcNAc-1-phosphate transferase